MVRNGVLSSFLLPETLYAEDVRAMMPSTIERYGIEEWRTIVMTNEIHGHLGIYSTLGAKMGLYALSLLDGEGEPDIESYAGTCPPISCLNDGLQISTGATLGHGLITVLDVAEKRVEAKMTRGGQSLRIALKSEYQQQIRDDIRHGVEQYGHTAPYWTYVRGLAIKYWAEWDRNKIFVVK